MFAIWFQVGYKWQSIGLPAQQPAIHRCSKDLLEAAAKSTVISFWLRVCTFCMTISGRDASIFSSTSHAGLQACTTHDTVTKAWLLLAFWQRSKHKHCSKAYHMRTTDAWAPTAGGQSQQALVQSLPCNPPAACKCLTSACEGNSTAGMI